MRENVPNGYQEKLGSKVDGESTQKTLSKNKGRCVLGRITLWHTSAMKHQLKLTGEVRVRRVLDRVSA